MTRCFILPPAAWMKRRPRAKLERICRRIPDAQSREETENLLKTVMNDGQDD